MESKGIIHFHTKFVKLIDITAYMFYSTALLLHSFFCMETSKPIETTDVDVSSVSLTALTIEQKAYLLEQLEVAQDGTTNSASVALALAVAGEKVRLNEDSVRQEIQAAEDRFRKTSNELVQSDASRTQCSRLLHLYTSARYAGLSVEVPDDIRDRLCLVARLYGDQSYGDTKARIDIVMNRDQALLGLAESRLSTDFYINNPYHLKHPVRVCSDTLSDIWKLRLLNLPRIDELCVLTKAMTDDLKVGFAAGQQRLQEYMDGEDSRHSITAPLWHARDARLLSAKTLRLLPEGLEVDGQLVVIQKIRPSIDGHVQSITTETRTDVDNVL